jgi:hypothetical protein
VDQVEIDVLESELAKAPFELGQRLGMPVLRIWQLRRDEQLRPVELAPSDCIADAGFVAVRRRGIDTAITGVEAVTDERARLIGGHLKHAETELRHLDAAAQLNVWNSAWYGAHDALSV